MMVRVGMCICYVGDSIVVIVCLKRYDCDGTHYWYIGEGMVVMV